MSKLNVLVVDDEAELREAIASYLELEDYNCFTASNGLEAFEIVEKENISFVISDISYRESGICENRAVENAYMYAKGVYFCVHLW